MVEQSAKNSQGGTVKWNSDGGILTVQHEGWNSNGGTIRVEQSEWHREVEE